MADITLASYLDSIAYFTLLLFFKMKVQLTDEQKRKILDNKQLTNAEENGSSDGLVICVTSATLF